MAVAVAMSSTAEIKASVDAGNSAEGLLVVSCVMLLIDGKTVVKAGKRSTLVISGNTVVIGRLGAGDGGRTSSALDEVGTTEAGQFPGTIETLNWVKGGNRNTPSALGVLACASESRSGSTLQPAVRSISKSRTLPDSMPTRMVSMLPVIAVKLDRKLICSCGVILNCWASPSNVTSMLFSPWLAVMFCCAKRTVKLSSATFPLLSTAARTYGYEPF